jgi:hypothetical protein
MPAAADSRPPGFGSGTINDDGDPTAEAVEPGAQPVQVGSGSSPWNCGSWTVWVEDDVAFAVWETEGERAYSETGRWLSRTCENSETGAVLEQTVADGAEVDVGALALQAAESVSISGPVLATSPAADSGLYVKVPTWLWVDGSWWTDYEATANAGRVSATVTARPVATSWSMGDGSTLSCAGQGTPWRPGLAEDATSCSHTYVSSSDGEADRTFDLAATVTLEVSWTSSTGASGTLPTITRSAAQPVRVAEIQAIETR